MGLFDDMVMVEVSFFRSNFGQEIKVFAKKNTLDLFLKVLRNLTLSHSLSPIDK